MDYFSLERHINELNSALPKAFLESVSSALSRTFALGFKSGSEYFSLYLALDGVLQGPRLKRGKLESFSDSVFSERVYKLLSNAFLAEMGMLRNPELPLARDRIIFLRFIAADPYFGIKKTFFLICEFTGRNSNIFLSDSDMIILEAYGRTANNSQGKAYVFPCSEVKADPLLFSPEELANFWTKHSFGDSSELLAGITNKILKEAVYRSKCEKKLPIRVANELLAFLKEYRDEGAYLYLKNKRVAYVSSVNFSHMEEHEIIAINSINDALLQAALMNVLPKALSDEKGKLLKYIETKIQAVKKLIKEQNELLELYSDHETVQHKGELINANLYQIKPGSKQVAVYDWLSDKTELIELDPMKTPHANSEYFFKQAKKYKRGIEAAKKRIEELDSELSWLKEQKWYASEAEDITSPVFAELKQYILPQKKKKSSKRDKNKSISRRSVYKIEPVFSNDNAVYYAGKNALENDFVTFKLAKSEDYWFHAKEVPGSHVIMKLKDKNTVPEDDSLIIGALLAARMSFSKNSQNVPVDYTKASNVRRIAGGKTGQVYYTHYKTLYVNPLELTHN